VISPRFSTYVCLTYYEFSGYTAVSSLITDADLLDDLLFFIHEDTVQATTNFDLLSEVEWLHNCSPNKGHISVPSSD